MSCIIYQTNKKTGIKYAYRSESYRDPVTKKPKSRRTYLGRVDPVTDEIIPKAEPCKRNRTSVSDTSIPDHIQDELASRNETIRTLRQQVSAFEATLRSLKAAIEDALASLPDKNLS